MCIRDSACVYGDFNTTGDGKWHGTWVSFWAQASKVYSQRAQGDINIVLTGHQGHPAYRRDSFFSSVEMKNMRVSRIRNVSVSVLPQSVREPLFEHCGEGSLALLEEDLQSIGIPAGAISCANSPEELMVYMCTRDPTAEECRLR
eukprot:TRINITY_DN16111_c0_g1_i1.p1 TRINITY_DN16111_c0_g1~~TRINITY_DN16111_c0_g1_i1.p1  ORF type:complete len:145 (+),score=30.75 TRINITY_DN16111_c0_g1_i1:119-553(+)